MYVLNVKLSITKQTISLTNEINEWGRVIYGCLRLTQKLASDLGCIECIHQERFTSINGYELLLAIELLLVLGQSLLLNLH